MKATGIDLHLSSKVTKVRNSGFSTTVAYEENGEGKICSCDIVLVAVGRKANVDDLGLENAGIFVVEELQEDGSYQIVGQSLTIRQKSKNGNSCSFIFSALAG
jgi:dihydrolipoamide dehydrogenase